MYSASPCPCLSWMSDTNRSDMVGNKREGKDYHGVTSSFEVSGIPRPPSLPNPRERLSSMLKVDFCCKSRYPIPNWQDCQHGPVHTEVHAVSLLRRSPARHCHGRLCQSCSNRYRLLKMNRKVSIHLFFPIPEGKNNEHFLYCQTWRSCCWGDNMPNKLYWWPLLVKQNFPCDAGSIEDTYNMFREGEKFL